MTSLLRILTPDQGNPNWPLPADFSTLTTEGARQARVNACRQWLVKGVTPYQRGENRVGSLHFFDQYYLHPDADANFDPLFYNDTPLESPPAHWDMVRGWAMFPFNLDICPRGFAKSTLIRKDIGLCTLTRPAYQTVYATSSHDNAKLTGQILRDLCFENERVQADFAPEFGGRIKPVRGDAPTGVEYFHLTSGAWVKCLSIESKLRGLRPDRFRLDDPEFDAKASTSMQNMRAHMDEALNKVILPMTMKSTACGVDWTATFVSKRHYAFHAMDMVETPTGPAAKDPRYNWWRRRLIRAAYEMDGQLHSCWPQMWPVSRAAKAADPRLATQRSLEEIREIIGVANFNSEYMANPGEGDSRFFGTLTDEKHRYWYEDVDQHLADNPRSSNSFICFYRKGKLIREPLHAWLAHCRLFITADTSYSAKPDSDYKVSNLMAVDYNTNELFVLDLWSGQTSEEALVNKMLQMANLWKVPTLHPELVRESISLYESLLDKIRTHAHEDMGYSFCPTVMKDNKPGNDNKEAKIAALSFRFEHGLIKLPKGRPEPWWIRLESQIDEYNPESEGGGLPHDDEIDTVAMSRKIIKGRTFNAPLPEDEPVVPFIDRLLAGESHIHGVPIANGIDWQTVPLEVVHELMRRYTNPTPTPGHSRA